MPDRPETAADLDEDGIDRAARAIWDEAPPGTFPHWEDIPDLSLTPLSRGDFRGMARAAVRAYQ